MLATSYRQLLGEPLATDLVRLGYGLKGFRRVYAYGPSVSACFVGGQPRKFHLYILLDRWNNDTALSVDVIVRSLLQSYQIQEILRGGCFLQYKIGRVDLTISSPLHLKPVRATHEALECTFFLHGNLDKVEISPTIDHCLTIETIVGMNARNESQLNYPRMHSIPDFYLLYLLDRFQGKKFTNLRLDEIVTYCCQSFYVSYELFPTSLVRKLREFIQSHFEIPLEFEAARNFLLYIRQDFEDQTTPTCQDILSPVFDQIDLAQVEPDLIPDEVAQFEQDEKEEEMAPIAPTLIEVQPMSKPDPLLTLDDLTPLHDPKTFLLTMKGFRTKNTPLDPKQGLLLFQKIRDLLKGLPGAKRKKNLCPLLEEMKTLLEPIMPGDALLLITEWIGICLLNRSMRNANHLFNLLTEKQQHSFIEYFCIRNSGAIREKHWDLEDKSLFLQWIESVINDSSNVMALASTLEYCLEARPLKDRGTILMRIFSKLNAKGQAILQELCLRLLLQEESMSAFVFHSKIKSILQNCPDVKFQVMHHLINVSSKNNNSQFRNPQTLYPLILDYLTELNRSHYIIKSHKHLREMQRLIESNNAPRNLKSQLKELAGRKQKKCTLPSSVKISAFITFTLLVGMRAYANHSQTVCDEWDKKVADEEENLRYSAAGINLVTDRYLKRAELNCKSYKKNQTKVIDYCNNGYDRGKIPKIWQSKRDINSYCKTQPTPNPLLPNKASVKLSCYAFDVNATTSGHYEIKKRLELKIAQRHHFCRGR